MSEAAERFKRVYDAWAVAGACDWRVHEDGTLSAVMPFIWTWAIVVGVRESDYDYRYCYPTLGDARAAFLVFEDYTQDPEGPWIKRKGHPDGEKIGPGATSYLAEQRLSGGDLFPVVGDSNSATSGDI